MTWWLHGCVNLPDVPPDVCGNGVVEAALGEQCDGFADTGQLCRGPKEASGCKFNCSEDIKLPATEKAPVCPAPMSCGLDGFCRIGTGTYSGWGDLQAQQAHALQLGDLDGDGRDDLLTLGNPSSLWQATPRVLFFDEVGKQRAAFDPQTRITSPRLAPVVAQQKGVRVRQQIVTGTSFGIATLQSNASREVTSLPHPFHTIPVGSEYRMLRVHGVADTPLKEEVLIYSTEQASNILISGATTQLLGILERPVSALSGASVAGNIDDRADSLCDELVLAYGDDSKIYTRGLCDADGRLTFSSEVPQAVASLPTGHITKSGVILARVDTDEHLDLLVADQFGCPYVSFGLGNGTFVADPAAPTLTIAQMWAVVTADSRCPIAAGQSNEFPLAIGDLNGQGLADWVLPNGISFVRSLSRDPVAQLVRLDTYAGNAPFVHQWSVASIAELTGDTHLDLVAGSSLTPDLDFLMGTGLDRLNPTTLQTDGPVAALITGDYDGDLISDIALVQAPPTEFTNPQTPSLGLAIAFGNHDGVPTAKIDIATLDSVEQLLSANYRTDDAVEEIGVITNAKTGTQLILFVGNPGRRPIASLGLRKQVSESHPATGSSTIEALDGAPLATTVGRMLNAESWSTLALAKDHCDAAVCSDSYRLWFMPVAENGELDDPSGPILAPGFLPYRKTSNELAAQFVVGHLDPKSKGDALPPDSVYLLTAGPDENQVSLWQVGIPLSTNPLTWLSARPGTLTPASSPLLLDLDGDRNLDLALLLEDANSLTPHPRLLVVWNRDGSLDLAQGEELELGDGTMVQALAKREAIAAAGLFVATQSGVYALVWNPESGVFDQTPVECSTADDSDPHCTGSLPSASSIAVGDMTGDGLADLAITTTSGGLRIFQQVWQWTAPQ